MRFLARRGHPYKKQRGACRKFWKDPQRGTKILICERGLIIFNRSTSLKTTHYLFIACHIFFRPNTLKGTAKASDVDLSRLNTSRATKTVFSLQRGTTNIRAFFIWESTPQGFLYFVYCNPWIPQRKENNLWQNLLCFGCRMFNTIN